MLESLEHALKLENTVNNQLHLVHHKAELECKDSHVSVSDFQLIEQSRLETPMETGVSLKI